jgi:hypothetical protein
MSSNHQPSVTPVLAFAAALAVVLAVAPYAQAKSAAFKATVQFEGTVKSTLTSTDPSACKPPITASQTVRFNTTKAQPVTANIVDAGSSQGLVELGPSGSGYAQIPGVVGTIERHADIPPDPCYGNPAEAQDCGMRSPKHWEVMVQPQSTRRHGREHLQGLAVFGAPVGPDPFSSCTPPETPPPAIAAVVRIDPGTLFDKRRRRIVLRINGTTPWRSEDKAGRTVTEGTYFHAITLTLRRTG